MGIPTSIQPLSFEGGNVSRYFLNLCFNKNELARDRLGEFVKFNERLVTMDY